MSDVNINPTYFSSFDLDNHIFCGWLCSRQMEVPLILTFLWKWIQRENKQLFYSSSSLGTLEEVADVNNQLYHFWRLSLIYVDRSLLFALLGESILLQKRTDPLLDLYIYIMQKPFF